MINDGPGFIWIPGNGPTPVDPGWANSIAAPQCDLIAALAVSEITRTIENPSARTKLNTAAVEAMRSAVDQIARMS